MSRKTRHRDPTLGLAIKRTMKLLNYLIQSLSGLKLFENRLQRVVSGSIRSWRKLHNDEHNNLYYSLE
jgi:hypothetical protein